MRLVTLIFAISVAIHVPAHAAGTDAWPLLNTKNTTAREVVSKPVRYKGRDGLQVKADPNHKGLDKGGCDDCTFLLLNGIKFRDGTIEIDVAGKPSAGAPAWARGFVGLVFRVNKKATKYEGIYLRPKNGTEMSQLRRNHTVQYFSYPDYQWKRLRKENPGKYESYAPVVTGEWTHMRIEVDGAVAKLYLNHAKEPSLIVNDLKMGEKARGSIGLFTEPHTDAYFRNLIVTHR